MKKNKNFDYLGTEYIARAIAEKAGITIKDAKLAYRVLPEVFTEAIQNNVPIHLSKFCTIFPETHNSQVVYNLDNSESISGLRVHRKNSEGGHNITLKLPPINTIKIKVSPLLKYQLNEGRYIIDQIGNVTLKHEILENALEEYYKTKDECK